MGLQQLRTYCDYLCVFLGFSLHTPIGRKHGCTLVQRTKNEKPVCLFLLLPYNNVCVWVIRYGDVVKRAH